MIVHHRIDSKMVLAQAVRSYSGYRTSSMKPGCSSLKVDKEVVVLLLPYGTLAVDLPVIEHIPPLSCEVPSPQCSSSRLAVVIVPPGA